MCDIEGRKLQNVVCSCNIDLCENGDVSDSSSISVDDKGVKRKRLRPKF